MANINLDGTTEPIESVQSSEVPQGNQDGTNLDAETQKIISDNLFDLFEDKPGHLEDTEGAKALGRKADNRCPDCDGDGWQEHLTESLAYHSWLCETCQGTGRKHDNQI